MVQHLEGRPDPWRAVARCSIFAYSYRVNKDVGVAPLVDPDPLWPASTTIVVPGCSITSGPASSAPGASDGPS